MPFFCFAHSGTNSCMLTSICLSIHIPQSHLPSLLSMGVSCTSTCTRAHLVTTSTHTYHHYVPMPIPSTYLPPTCMYPLASHRHLIYHTLFFSFRFFFFWLCFCTYIYTTSLRVCIFIYLCFYLCLALHIHIRIPYPTHCPHHSSHC